MFTPDGLKNLPPQGFENGDHLFPFHAGKPLKETLDRVPGFKMVKEASDRHTGADKDNGSSEDFRVGVDDGFQLH